ncbi:hypothetical protein DHEL01_v201905 [Diaporthe helianthi]|uniref:Clr5 domain-containing protein n=1 Tax=Diaporthe helianthi TaxID=158607 RepID=A0A2P5IB14_DIAHE|nr:hypothetical protein DHEL01_v201905 [Diaporthe helianthi]
MVGVGGRPRADFDKHKDLIIKLYREKTPWSKIEEVLLKDHGCRVKSRTIMRRFKEWNLDFHRVITNRSDDLNHHIKAYWEDPSTRPKTDEELLAKLHADGFTVTLSAIIQIRKKLNLFRRWDERLGRYRPDAELGRRGRRRQKHNTAFTEAKLVPPPSDSDPEDSQQESGQVEQQPLNPGAQSVGDSPAGQSSPPHPGRPPAWPTQQQPGQSIQLAPGRDPVIGSRVDSGIINKDE